MYRFYGPQYSTDVRQIFNGYMLHTGKLYLLDFSDTLYLSLSSLPLWLLTFPLGTITFSFKSSLNINGCLLVSGSVCSGLKLLSCWCQESCGARHLKGIWHPSRLSLRTQSSLSAKAEMLYWQRWPVFAELEDCDKVSGGHSASGPQVIIKADRASLMSCLHLNIHMSCFRCSISAQICTAAVYWTFEWEVRVEISGGKQSHRWEEEEDVRDMRGDERRSWEGWEHGHCLRAAPISLLESDQSIDMNTHAHTHT